MNWNSIAGGSTVDALIDIEIEKTPDSFHAFAVPNDIEIREGDAVLMHGVPTEIAFGAVVVMQCRATVHRAGMVLRAWTRLIGMLELTELYEVGFQPKDQIESGFVSRHARKVGVST